MAARGRSSAGASTSNNSKTRSAQSAAHAATRRRSASLSVCGDLTIQWCFSAERARGESGNYPSLREQHDQRDRQRDHDNRRVDEVIEGLVLALAEVHYRQRSHVIGRTGNERQREQEVVPAEDETEDRDRENSRHCDRNDDPAQRLQAGRAIDDRRLLELARDLAEEARQEPGGERQGIDEVRNDQPAEVVQQ